MNDDGRLTKRVRQVVLAVALLAAMVALAGAGVWVGKHSADAAVSEPPPEVANLEAVQRGLTWVANSVKSSVVFIEVERKVAVSSGRNVPRPEEWFDVPLPEEWKRFFGPGTPSPRPEQPDENPPRIPVSQGSGVVIDPDGYIVTNEHVVDGATKVTVRLADGDYYSAEVKGTDKLTDLAVIKINPKRPLSAAKLGDASKAEVGAWVMAVGYPFGGTRSGGRFDEAMHFEPAVTLGVISAKDRQIASNIPGRPFRNLIQTDAPINVGNSGGALVNIRGEVVGINQAIFTSAFGGGNIGLGFATAVNAETKDIIESLKGGGALVRGRIGVTIEAVTGPIAHDYGVDRGVFVNEVEPGGPADQAGIQSEDVIVRYNGKKVSSQSDFVSWVLATKPDTVVDVEVVRDRKPKTLKVTVGALTPEGISPAPKPEPPKKLGLTVAPLQERDGRREGVPDGLKVESVEPLSDAARSGIRVGDILVKVGGQSVPDVETYSKVIARLKKGDPLTMRVWRAGHLWTAQIERLSK